MMAATAARARLLALSKPPAPRAHFRRRSIGGNILTAATAAVVAAASSSHPLPPAAAAAAAFAAFSTRPLRVATTSPGRHRSSPPPSGLWAPAGASWSPEPVPPLATLRPRPGGGAWPPPPRRAAFAEPRRWLSSSSSSSSEQTPNERRMTSDALSITDAAIEAVNPHAAVVNCLSPSSPPSSSDEPASPAGLVVTDPSTGRRRLYPADDYDEVLVVAFGKASSAMAAAAADAVAEALPDAAVRGVATVKDGHAAADEVRRLSAAGVAVREASHPVPDGRSAAAAEEILGLVDAAADRTLVLCCISGGGSALFCHPRPPLSLDDLAASNAALLSSGMDIRGMNVIRKRLESGKGGRLAARAHPATVVGLVLSDIVGDPLDLIASGPTVPDPSGWDDAAKLVAEYGLGRGGKYELPPKVLDLFDEATSGGAEGEKEAAGVDHPAFLSPRRAGDDDSDGGMRLTETVLVGNNALAVEAAAVRARDLGYHPVVLGTTIEGEARHVAGVYASVAERLALQRDDDAAGEVDSAFFPLAPLPAAVIAGGETTVTLPPSCSGRGGRNQELALAAAIRMREAGLRDAVLASVGTDGTDGPTDAAGAVADGGTVGRVEAAWVEAEEGGTKTAEEALREHDAYTFFDAASGSEREQGPLVRTGPTGTNVADVCVILVS